MIIDTATGIAAVNEVFHQWSEMVDMTIDSLVDVVDERYKSEARSALTRFVVRFPEYTAEELESELIAAFSPSWYDAERSGAMNHFAHQFKPFGGLMKARQELHKAESKGHSRVSVRTAYYEVFEEAYDRLILERENA